MMWKTILRCKIKKVLIMQNEFSNVLSLLNLIKTGFTLFPWGYNIILLRTLIIGKILSGIRSVLGGEVVESSCSCPIQPRFFFVIVKSCSFTFFLLLLMPLSSSYQTNKYPFTFSAKPYFKLLLYYCWNHFLWRHENLTWLIPPLVNVLGVKF